jgi:hypothetical protein
VRTILPHPEALANDVRFQVAVADAAILPPKGVPSIRSSTRGIASCASAKETHSNIVAIAKLNIFGVTSVPGMPRCSHGCRNDVNWVAKF